MKRLGNILLLLAGIALAVYNTTLNERHTRHAATMLANLLTLANAESPNSTEYYPNPYFLKMDSVFALADKSRITTGLLSDYGLQLIEPSYFDGIPADSNYVDLDTWKMLYAGIYSSKVNNNVSLTSPATVFSQIENTTHATAAPLVVMHIPYNQLDENALSQGLVTVVNEQIIDVPGAASPYLTKQLFAVAPKSIVFDGPTASFVFYSTLFYNKSGKTVQSRQIKFDNETGYISAVWNTPVSHTFATEGIKNVYFKLTYTNVPGGATISWQNSSNLSKSGDTGNSKVFTAIGSGDAWIEAYISLWRYR